MEVVGEHDGDVLLVLAAEHGVVALNPPREERHALVLHRRPVQGDELEVLGILIDKYEQENYPIDFPDPIEAIKFRMEQLGYSQSDLANVVGLKSRASEILNKKRKLTLDMIRNLHDILHIPTDVLIQSY